MDASEQGTEEAAVPPGQGGFVPQRLLITLLGDYWYDHGEHIPSAALVQLLAEFGVSDAGSRAALSRLARRGLLVSSKSGRRTFYGLSERAGAAAAGLAAPARAGAVRRDLRLPRSLGGAAHQADLRTLVTRPRQPG